MAGWKIGLVVGVVLGVSLLLGLLPLSILMLGLLMNLLWRRHSCCWGKDGKMYEMIKVVLHLVPSLQCITSCFAFIISRGPVYLIMPVSHPS